MHNDTAQWEATRRILVSAADVIFSDGVSEAFLDQWTTETLALLECRAVRVPV